MICLATVAGGTLLLWTAFALTFSSVALSLVNLKRHSVTLPLVPYRLFDTVKLYSVVPTCCTLMLSYVVLTFCH